jgi:tRNA pseudouridine55 synthase
MTINQSGWLILDKPIEISSAGMLNKLKHLLGIKKLGHAGTLDPMASGVLVVAIGEATKAIEFAMSSQKSYEFTITWGEHRDTVDVEGKILQSSDVRPTKEQIENILGEFTPSYMQTPPKYSAVKVSGKRAYDMARKGEEFDIRPKLVELSEIAITEHFDDKTAIRITCGKGFYVRSLAVDIASRLGALGYVSYLRRTRVGKFVIEDAILLETLEKLMHNGMDRNWGDLVLPITAVLDDILVQQVSEAEVACLRFGRKVHIASESKNEEVIAAYRGNPVAICRLEDGFLIPKRVFNLYI